jgi:hypothetical protein
MRRLLLTGTLALIAAALIPIAQARWQRADVIALSFHVDYWDYTGGKDRFTQPEFTARQHQYRRALKSRYVYTPQIVIKGQVHSVGSDVDEVEHRIVKFREMADDGSQLSLRHHCDDIIVAVGAGQTQASVDIFLSPMMTNRRLKLPVGKIQARG